MTILKIISIIFILYALIWAIRMIWETAVKEWRSKRHTESGGPH